MAIVGQKYFLLKNDVPSAKTNSFFRTLLSTQNADHVLKGELLVKEAQPHDGSHCMYSQALDGSKKVSCVESDVIPLSEDDYEWLVAIQKHTDRDQMYSQREKFESVKRLQIYDRVWVSLPLGEGTSSHSSSTTCCHATVRYIGPIQGMPGRWIGVELKEKKGSCDGTFRNTRYFMCKEDHGVFLPANLILSVSTTTSVPPVPTATPQKKLLLSAMNSKTDRDFYLDDQVVVFDKEGQRVPGVAKWVIPGKEYGLTSFVIGIETDIVMKKEKVEEHLSGKSGLFSKKDYKKHSYLAVPERCVLKEGEGTPVDGSGKPAAGHEVMALSSSLDVTASVRAVARDIASESRRSPTDVISEQVQALQESEAKKEKADNEKLAASFGIPPEQFKAQQEQYMKLKRQQSENEQRRVPHPGPGMGSGANGQGLPPFSSTQGDVEIQNYPRSPVSNRRHASTFDRQGSVEHQAAQPHPPGLASYMLEVGTAVELVDPQGYGTIRWLGKFPGVDQDIAGVEMETRMPKSGDGSWNGVRYFTCKDGHALFILLSKLKPDARFVPQTQGRNPVDDELRGKEQKLKVDDALAVEELKLDHFIGPMRGIQGHQNSCYLDATVFAMFGLTSKFDEILYETPADCTAESVLETMCEEIIFPLRRNSVVRYDPVMKLREALDKLNRVKGLTHAEQDPEEFLNLLFKHVLDVKEPFIKLKRPSGVDTEFFFQLFLEQSDKDKWTVGEMLRKSMEDQQITFAEAPGRLIIQLPRYGKAYKVYETVYPELELDISPLCSDYVPQDAICSVCGKIPTHRCQKCGKNDTRFLHGVIHFFCESCVTSAHVHPDRQGHIPEAIGSKRNSEKVILELMSVVCIEKSHYVCFTRFGDNWVFFDSMADRTDDQYNIPEITRCPAVGETLKYIDAAKEKEVSQLHPLVKRLVKDASICFYAAPHVGMY